MRFEARTQIVGSDSDDVFRKARPIVEAALEHMLSRPEVLGPFVILEDVASERFVQWCGGATRALRFEAPAVDLVETENLEVPSSVFRGLSVLQEQCEEQGGEPPFSKGVVVIEQDTFDASIPVEDRARLSVALLCEGVFQQHSEHESLLSARAVVKDLAGEWAVVNVDCETPEAQLAWWEANRWARSDTAERSEK